MWVVLVGPHCAGKTTVGQALADRLGWVFDGEIGDQRRNNPFEGDGDNEILRLEMQRDLARTGTCRVVETWHFGNAAWATYRNQSSDVSVRMLEAAIEAKEREPTIICFAVRCKDDERQRRWISLKSRQVRLGTEVETLEKTNAIGSKAEAVARNILPQRVRTVWTGDSQSVAEVVDEIQREILGMVIPEQLYHNLQTARQSVLSASHVLPELHQSLPKGCMDLPLLRNHGDSEYPSIVVVVEGLDGTGKTTLVERLEHHLGSTTVPMRSPPVVLTEARAFIEEECSIESDPPAYKLRNSKAFRRLNRAFFSFGNYVLAEELLQSKTCAPVVIDRFASSTLAYTQGSIDAEQPHLETHNKTQLVWPNDLPQPDMVLILDADEHVRRQRIQQRSMGTDLGLGEWEKALERNVRLGPSISYHLKNIKNGPPCEIVDVNTDDVDKVFRRAATKLLSRGIAVVFRDVIDAASCEAIINDLDKASKSRLDQGTLDRYKWDKTNKVYQSGRHQNIEVCFLQTKELKEKIAEICTLIAQATGLSGWTVENDILPVFRYWDQGEMLPHRDVNLTSLDEYCAVLMVSQNGVDFSGGALYVNGCATVSEKGHLDTEVPTKRQYFDLQQGDIVVFRNSQCIHGVDQVKVAPPQVATLPDSQAETNSSEPHGRITTSFRIGAVCSSSS